MEPFKYALRNTTRTGLLAELRNKGIQFGSFDEETGEFTEHIPDLFEQASIRPWGLTAVYTEKLPNANYWHVDVASPFPIEWNTIQVVDVATPYNVV